MTQPIEDKEELIRDKPREVPPPPKPSEYFPGFGAEKQQYSEGLYGIEKQVIKAATRVDKINLAGTPHPLSYQGTSPVMRLLFGTPEGWFQSAAGGIISPETIAQQRAEAQAELDLSTRELESLEWRLEILNTLPGYLASQNYTISNVDDVLKLTSNSTLSAVDRDWLEGTLDKLDYLNNTLPADFTGSIEDAQNKIVTEILSEPKLETRAVHNLAIDELERSMQPFAIDMPEGLTAENMRKTLSYMQLDEETQVELDVYLRERASAWAKETDRLNLIRAGLLQPESPELTPGEFANLMFVQPVMGSIQLLDKYFDMLPRPLASAAIIGVHKLFKTDDETLAGRMHDTYQYYKSKGETDWASYALAMSETDMNWLMRMGIETAFDLTSYIGIGFGTAAAKMAGRSLTRVGLKTVGSRIGPFVGAMESGFAETSDLVFKAGMKAALVPVKGAFWLISAPVKGGFWLSGAGYQIPRTITQMSRNFARQTSMNFKAVADRAFPNVRNMTGLTARELRETAEACVNAAIERPGEGHDLMVKTGTELMEFKYIGSDEWGAILKGVVDEGFEFDTIRLSRLNDEVLNMFSGQSPQITSGNIITKLGLIQTDASFNKVMAKLAVLKDDIIAGALKPFKGENPTTQLISMFDNAVENRYANLASPLATHMTQAGRAVSWVSRVSDRFLHASRLVNFERKVVMPYARWNLLFANFGPFNFLENMQRSFLGGGEILYPKSYGGVAETNRLFRGLTNAPYELQMAERGAQRMEMALVDPKTGSTTAFNNGKIPFITKGVKFRGRDIGKSISIRGKEYKLTDFQSYNDMWEEMTTIQRSYDYQVHYMKALYETAPDEMQQLADFVLTRRNELEQIGKYSPKDITDVERVMIQDATVGYEAVAAHLEVDVLELEKRQISQQLGKTFDKCTDVRTGTKVGIRNEILDGSIFADIDGRMAARVAEEQEMSLVSLTKQIDAMQTEADDFVKAYTNTATLLDELSQDIGLGDVTEGLVFSDAPIRLDGEDVGKLTFHPGATPDEMVISELEVTAVGKLNRRFMLDMDTVIHNLAKERGYSKVTIVSKDKHKLMYTGTGYKQTIPGYFSKELMEPASHAPKNLDELLGDLENITGIQNAVDERIHDYRSLVELRSQKLKPGKEVDDFHTGSNKLLGKFMEESKVQMDKIVDELKRFTGTVDAPLTPQQKSSVDSLADLYRLENSNVMATRNELSKIESVIPNTRKKIRAIKDVDARIAASDRFWKQQRLDKSVVWNTHTINARKLKNLRLDASRSFLTSAGKAPYLPETLMPVAGKLTPSHISYLFGVSGDDVYRGLTRVHHHSTIRPKEDFVLYIKNQADAYARKFETSAADIGFSSDAIGEVYDQLWRNLGMEPSTLTPDSPTVMQLDDIRQELNRLHATVKMDETDVVKWRKYVSGVAEDVKGSSMYKTDVPEAKLPGTYKEGKVYYRGLGEAVQKEKWAEHQFYTTSKEEAVDMFGPEVVESTFSPSKPLVAESEEEAVKLLGIEPDMVSKFGDDWQDELYDWTGEELIVNAAKKAGYDAIDLDTWFIVLKDDIIRPAKAVSKVGKPGVTTPDQAAWLDKKEQAMTRAREMHELAYPTYDDANVIDETMRAIFPFWTYEAFRWKWMPRTWMRTPGTMTGMARYMDNTDGGYIPIPGTDLQLNPLRGSIWAGGMRRFFMKDFPEYYDAMPGMEQIDTIGRAGFYPGIHIMAPITVWGATVGDKPEFNEVLPAFMKTGLSALRALSPEHMGKVIDHFFPDRYRDFQTMLTLGKHGYDADDIWSKVQQGIKLEEGEEKIWLRAEAEANGLKGILMEQSGIFRIRPEEYEDIKREMGLAIEEATGVPVSIQQQIDRMSAVTGKRFSDYYKLDVLQQKLLYQNEDFRRWQGMVTPLLPSGWQNMEIKIRDYYETLEKMSTEARYTGLYEDGELVRPSIVDLNRQRVTGEIGPDQWKSAVGSIKSQQGEAARVLGESPAYKDVPKTLEEREAWLREKGVVTPTYGADQELLWYYYELEPELKYNWDSDRMELDFDTYYAHVDALLESLDETHRQRLLTRIQSDWTPMERLYWSVSREYLRPYRNVRTIVMGQYSDEERQQIRRYEVARGTEREALKEVIGPDGEKLIAGFNTNVREARQRLRYADPELDAWSYFFGNTDSFITTTAEEMYNDMTKQYLKESMVE